MQQLEPIERSTMPGAGPIQALQHLIKPWFPGRRGIVVAATAVILLGLALGWNWLSAIGAAPIILSLAPCALMCALGACAMKGNSSCAKSVSPADPTSHEPTSIATQSKGQDV